MLNFFLLSRGYIETLFSDITLLVTIKNNKLYILHASLADFLLDPGRSNQYLWYSHYLYASFLPT